MKYTKLEDIAVDYPDRTEREAVLKDMPNEQIDVLIKNMPNIQGKIYLKGFKK